MVHVAAAAAPSPSRHEQRQAMSYEDFLALSDGGVQAEWINGEAIVFMPPTLRHQRLIIFFAELLQRYCRVRALGEILIAPFEMRALPDGPAREPDILFVARQHLERLSEQRLDGPADLIVEIVSESSVYRDRVDKFEEYEAERVAEYLLIDPRAGHERIDYHRLGDDQKYCLVVPDTAGCYHSAALPGLWFRADWFWQTLLPDTDPLLRALLASEC